MISRTGLLAGSSAALLLLLLLEWVVPAAGLPPGAQTPIHLAPPPRHGALPARQAAGWAATILARPLFSISRRPPRVVEGGKLDTGAGQARLSGIMISPLGRRAIFAPDGGGKPLVLAEGSSVNDSIIRSIQPDRVILATGAVLHPTYDSNRSTLTTTSPFQPVLPNFANPAFNAPSLAPNGFNPGFQPPGFQPPGFQPGTIPPALQSPGFRGALMPQRRE
jgi:hypothetical protein